MNDTFELKRFGLLFKKTILERPVQLIGLTGLILILTFVIYAGVLYFVGWNPAQNLAFIWGFVGGGCFMSAAAFSYFSTNAAGSAYLTLPASAFEKWLCGILIAGVLFCAVFLVFFKVMDFTFVTIYHNRLDKNSPLYRGLYDAVHCYTFDNRVVEQSFALYFNFAGAMLLGALYFNRVSPVKTALIYCGVLAVIYALNLLVVSILFQNVDLAFPYVSIFLKVKNGQGIVELPHFASNVVNMVFMYALPVTLWLTAYIRLSEKEI